MHGTKAMTWRLAKTGSTIGLGISSHGHKTVARITVMTIGAGSLGTSTEQAAGRVGSDGGDVDGQGRPVFWPPAIQ